MKSEQPRLTIVAKRAARGMLREPVDNGEYPGMIAHPDEARVQVTEPPYVEIDPYTGKWDYSFAVQFFPGFFQLFQAFC